MRISLQKWTLSSLTFIFIVLFFTISNLRWGQNSWSNIIESDAKGYYAYLPGTFVYHDLNFGFFDDIERDKYYNENTFVDYLADYKGKKYTKYYCGTALVQSPFYLVAHSYVLLFGGDPDGYSRPYLISVTVAGLFYAMLGLIYLAKLLQLNDVSDKSIAVVLLCIALGTNLFYYTIGEMGLSHVYSFCFITMFLYYLQRYIHELPKNIPWKLFVLFGIILLIRPINGLILFAIPLLTSSSNQLVFILKQAINKPARLVLGGVIVLSILSIQLIIYKVQLDVFWVYSYKEEGFNWFKPNIINILFSYKKGLFLYTPIYFIATLSSLYFLKWNKWKTITWLSFFFLITYVFSSWWMWYYGGSFSSRVYVEYLAVFSIPLGVMLTRITSKPIKRSLVASLLLLIIVCQIQTFQYRRNEIHWSEMTKDKYWDTFLRRDKLN